MGLSLVSGHAGLHGEALATDVTHVRPLSSVHPDKHISQPSLSPIMSLPHVTDQVGLSPKTCVTFITLVRLGVDLLVDPLVTRSTEGFGTMFALEPLF